LPSPEIQLTDIWLVKETEPLVKAFALTLATGPTAVENKSANDCTTSNGIYIGGAHIYRSTST
jgi:hypothetical protein